MKVKNRFSMVVLTVALVLGLSGVAQADFLRPVAAEANSTYGGTTTLPIYMIEEAGTTGARAGLSEESPNATHANSGGGANFGHWHANAPAAGVEVWFQLGEDLGGGTFEKFSLSALYLWNSAQGSLVARGIKDFTVWASSDGGNTYTQVAGPLVAEVTPSGQESVCQTFEFVAIGVTHIKIDIDSNYDGSNYATIAEVRFETGLPTSATVIAPDDGAVDIARDGTSLIWGSGLHAVKHEVYFGMNFDDVTNATPGSAVHQGQQTDNALDLPRLELGGIYFWRIDEVNDANPDGPWIGDVWSFEVEPVGYPVTDVSVTASDNTEDPNRTIDGSGLADGFHGTSLVTMWKTGSVPQQPVWIQFAFDKPYKLSSMKVWNHNSSSEGLLGYGFKDVTIETSEDDTTWSALADVQFPQAPGKSNYAGVPIDLTGRVARYVKLTGKSNWSALGLQNLGLSEVRFDAIPMQARLPVPASGTTNLDPMVNLSWRAGREAAKHELLMGTDPDALTLLADALDSASYEASVELNKTIYWQVNEVNEAGDPAVWDGPLWSFSTVAYQTVDNMESYSVEVGEEFFATWADGYEKPANGALVGHGFYAEPETLIVHDGAQSMPLYYGKDGASMSETTRLFAPAEDWSLHGIRAMSLQFYGDPANTTGQMYIKINGTKVDTYMNPADMKQPQWHAWTFDLPAGLTGVENMTIGIEGGEGIIYVDTIRLYPLASEMISPVAPNNTGLMAHYTFDGNASDVSGNGNNGTLNGSPEFVAGHDGSALDCDGIDNYVSTGKTASTLGIGGNNPRTVSAWVLTRSYNGGGIFDVGARVTGQDFCLRTLATANTWRVQYWGGDSDFTFDATDKWVHFTHVHDGVTTKVYANGILVVDWVKTIDTPDTNPFQIGRYGWPEFYFDGLIDEVRIYNRALSQGEALGLAGRTDPIYKPF